MKKGTILLGGMILLSVFMPAGCGNGNSKGGGTGKTVSSAPDSSENCGSSGLRDGF